MLTHYNLSPQEFICGMLKSAVKGNEPWLKPTVVLKPFLCCHAVTTTDVCAEDPSELSNHITAPGILKIFGNEIREGAHYKSVLATTDSSAKELVKEALER